MEMNNCTNEIHKFIMHRITEEELCSDLCLHEVCNSLMSNDVSMKICMHMCKTVFYRDRWLETLVGC